MVFLLLLPVGWKEEAGPGTGPLPGGAAEANPGHLPGGGRKWGWGLGVGWPSRIGKQLELPLSAQAPCPSGRPSSHTHSFLPESEAVLDEVP